jgi:hypothetical protein
MANARPPVMMMPMMEFDIQCSELFFGRVVADLLLWHPVLHIVEPQLAAQEKSKVPLKQQGWQDAVEAVYPFKINRLSIAKGDITYIENQDSAPLHLSELNLTTENIRNIRSPKSTYPSTFHCDMVVFGVGRASMTGEANYLEEPFPGVKAQYKIENMPLKLLTSVIKRANFRIEGGRLFSEGMVEYSPRGTDLEVNTATVESVNITYVHEKATAPAEVKRIKTAGSTVKAENNRPGTLFLIRRFEVRNGTFNFLDRSTNPTYALSLDQAMLTIQNLSNHRDRGRATFNVTGKFMGSGETTLSGAFVASAHGPSFNLDLAIRNTQLTLLNDLLRAYGRFNVAAGQF